jgi:hypothetical protein
VLLLDERSFSVCEGAFLAADVSRFSRRHGVRPRFRLVQRGDDLEKYEAGEESCGCREGDAWAQAVNAPGGLLRLTLPTAPFC